MATPADMLARLMAEQMQKTGTPTDDAETAAPAEQPNQSAEIIRLPVWPDSVRGLPNTVLRSALFGNVNVYGLLGAVKFFTVPGVSPLFKVGYFQHTFDV